MLLAAAAFAGRPALAAPDGDKKATEPPKPEDLVLDTDENLYVVRSGKALLSLRGGVAGRLQLTLTYYASTKGKKAVPIVLLHMYKQSRTDYRDLALYLQSQGHAVIVPDLRGHGESKRVRGGEDDATLNTATYDVEKARLPDFGLMVTRDMEAVKDFLRERNNSGELNIDKLCVVGAEMGACVALNFALADALEQNNNRVRRSDYKLGGFVKALVLISPTGSFHGLSVRAATANPTVQNDIAMFILVGKKDARALEEATQIYNIFSTYHDRFLRESSGLSNSEVNDRRTLFFRACDTNLQGTKLLDPKFNVPAMIADFVYRRLIKSDESKNWTWQERKIPHQ
jgi:pimeloyl-ACP methyl ester carboxylesterase